jgi:hypothetical protein
MQCRFCHGPLVELGGLANAMHYRCRDCGADQSRMTKTTDVNRSTKTRQEIALAAGGEDNPVRVCDVLAEEMVRFCRTPDYDGTARSIVEDPCLKAICLKLAALFGLARQGDDITQSMH